MAVKTLTQPLIEPVTLAEAKLHLRNIGTDLEDSLILQRISAAREYVEQTLTNRAFIRQTLELVVNGWPRKYIDGHLAGRLLRPPIQSVTSIIYRDTDGTNHTMPTADYIVDTDSEPGLVVPDTSWPSERLYKVNAVRVRYVAGYDTHIGTVDTASASATIAWNAGDKFNIDWPVDKRIIVNGETHHVAEVIDDETLTVQKDFSATETVSYSTNSVPEPFKQAILLLLGHYFDNREAILPIGHNVTLTPFGVNALSLSDRIPYFEHNWGTG